MCGNSKEIGKCGGDKKRQKKQEKFVHTSFIYIISLLLITCSFRSVGEGR